jgi:pimeloyl-ACP methyl ester carboxylesterase
MAPVARELSSEAGVLEPLQTKASLEGQVQELRKVLKDHAALPLTLIGSSWGAMLSFILTARYTELVSRLILVGSGVYEDKYAAGIMPTRLDRLSEQHRIQALAIMQELEDPEAKDKNSLLARFGEVCTRADAYDPITLDTEVIACDFEINIKVWSDAQKLRAKGGFLELGRQIKCPVVAIHGDYDPHPAQGVKEPLSSVLKDFKFIMLDHCGHLPWIERQARRASFEILSQECSM